MRCHPSPRRYSDDLGRQPSDSGSSEIQSRDAPCGSVQPTGTPFTAIRKQPLGPSVAARAAIFGKIRGDSFEIQESQRVFTDRANSSRSGRERM